MALHHLLNPETSSNFFRPKLRTVILRAQTTSATKMEQTLTLGMEDRLTLTFLIQRSNSVHLRTWTATHSSQPNLRRRQYLNLKRRTKTDSIALVFILRLHLASIKGLSSPRPLTILLGLINRHGWIRHTKHQYLDSLTRIRTESQHL